MQRMMVLVLLAAACGCASTPRTTCTTCVPLNQPTYQSPADQVPPCPAAEPTFGERVRHAVEMPVLMGGALIYFSPLGEVFDVGPPP